MDLLRKLGLKSPGCYGGFTHGKRIDMDDCFSCPWRVSCIKEEKRKKTKGYISDELRRG
jgi:hypothetical protein